MEMLLQALLGRNVVKQYTCAYTHYFVGSVVEWLERRTRDQHGLFQNPLAPFCCVFGKGTLRHIPLLGGPGKQCCVLTALFDGVKCRRQFFIDDDTNAVEIFFD